MTIERMLALVRQQADVEDVRGDVFERHLAPLAAAYEQLDWGQRLTWVELVQDHLSPITRPLMEDFLARSPDQIARGDAEVGRVIAMCHVVGDLAAFDRYLRDPAAIAARRRS
jgi:hypothetical protein